MMANDESYVLTVEEAAQYLRVGRSACYEAVRLGQIPSIRVGRSIRVPRLALERLMAGESDQRVPAGLRVIEGGLST